MTSELDDVGWRGIATAILVGCLLTSGSVAYGEQQQDEARSDRVEDESEHPQTSSLEEQVRVVAEPAEIQTASIDLESLDTGRAPNVAVALDEVVGVAGVRRSANGYEPVIRGLGWEHVQTRVNGMPLYGACPARMDPPAFVVAPSSVERVSVVKGLASVTLGPAGTGGRIDISTDFDRGIEAAKDSSPWVRLSHDGATDGTRGGAGIKGGTKRIDYSAGVEFLDQGDYESAGGTTVPASEEEIGGFLSFGNRVTDTQRWSVSAVVNEHENVSYPSLPMDTESSTNRIFTGAYSLAPQAASGRLTSLELSLGASRIDHLMSNRFRTDRPTKEAETDSEATTYRAGVLATWEVGASTIVTGGFDLDALERDAMRER